MITDPAELRAALCTRLRANTALVTLLANDSSRIFEFNESGDLTSQIQKLSEGSLLVYLEAIQPAGFPALFSVGFGIAVRSKYPTAAYAAIMNDTQLGVPMIGATIHAAYLPMEPPSLERLFIPVGQSAVFDYWAIRTSFREKASV